MPQVMAGDGQATSAEPARHPWETARAEFFVRLACEHLPRDRPSAVLDVGSGDGYFARTLLAALPPGSTVTCLDTGYSDEVLARLSHESRPGVSFTRARPERVFDALILLDVIEHVIDDHGFLRTLAQQSVRPGGAVVISVPAYPMLYTQHDVDLGHHRRYTRTTLAELQAGAQLEVVESGGLFSSLLVARGAQKVLELIRGIRSQPAPAGLAEHVATEVGTWRAGALVTRAIHSVLAVDAVLGERLARARVAVPGLSVWSVCRRS